MKLDCTKGTHETAIRQFCFRACQRDCHNKTGLCGGDQQNHTRIVKTKLDCVEGDPRSTKAGLQELALHMNLALAFAP
eukprot:1159649-Pelagomonas_calceolata.AAC.9